MIGVHLASRQSSRMVESRFPVNALRKRTTGGRVVCSTLRFSSTSSKVHSSRFAITGCWPVNAIDNISAMLQLLGPARIKGVPLIAAATLIFAMPAAKVLTTPADRSMLEAERNQSFASSAGEISRFVLNDGDNCNAAFSAGLEFEVVCRLTNPLVTANVSLP